MKSNISIVLNSSLHESIFLESVIIPIFFYSEYINTIRGGTPKNYAIGYDRLNIRKI